MITAGLVAIAMSGVRVSEPLFNGKDLSGWVMDVPAMDEGKDVKAPFLVRDGKLVSLGQPRGHLVTEKSFKNYKITAEYRFVGKSGNCGILVHASEPRILYKMFPKSLEVQMQSGHAGDFWCIGEDIVVPNMVERRGPKENWGALEGKARRIANLTDDSENKLGEWNTMEIVCKGAEVMVWVNGDLVNHGRDCTASEGKIAVQAEGVEVEFKKLDIQMLGK